MLSICKNKRSIEGLGLDIEEDKESITDRSTSSEDILSIANISSIVTSVDLVRTALY